VTRGAATAVWGATVVLPFFFMAVADSARWGAVRPETTTPLFWLTVLVSAVAIAASRLLPPRLGPFHAGAEATAFTRLLVGWALCEAAALFPMVAWIVAGDLRLIGVLAVDVLALVLLFPSDHRWDSLRPGAVPSPRRSR
jgi:F0F1-type ATP synthase membrane subunit c/vacuolar-type H+-ATPase subunit K